METKIVLVLTLIALAIGYCKGYNNIYGHEDEELYKKEKLERHFTDEYAPDPEEVARLLIKAENKDETLEATKGVTISKLTQLTSRSVLCFRSPFADYEEWRELYSGPDGNVYLFNYVNENLERLRDFCAKHIDTIFKHETNTLSPEGRYSRRISEYAKTTGEEDDPEEKTVSDFLAAKILDDEEEQKLIKGCAELVPHVKESLAYFMRDNKKASDYLDNLGDTERALLYKRCKIINQMFGKQ